MRFEKSYCTNVDNTYIYGVAHVVIYAQSLYCKKYF